MCLCFYRRIIVPLFKMLDMLFSNGCFELFTQDERYIHGYKVIQQKHGVSCSKLRWGKRLLQKSHKSLHVRLLLS